MSKQLWPLLTGFTLWALAFIALYGLQHLGCYFGWAPAQHRAVLVAGYVVSLLVLGGYLALQIGALRRNRPAATALDGIGVGTSVAALVATAITMGPVAFASLCL